MNLCVYIPGGMFFSLVKFAHAYALRCEDEFTMLVVPVFFSCVGTTHTQILQEKINDTREKAFRRS